MYCLIQQHDAQGIGIFEYEYKTEQQRLNTTFQIYVTYIQDYSVQDVEGFKCDPPCTRDCT